MLGKISFSMVIRRPRREFVYLLSCVLPSDVGEFLDVLREATSIAYMKHEVRYGVRPRSIEVQVQRGQTSISWLRVILVHDLTVEQWRCYRTSPLFDVRMQWRFLTGGQVAKYYSALDARNILSAPSWDRVIFRQTPIGATTAEQVLADASVHSGVSLRSSSVWDRLDLYQSECEQALTERLESFSVAKRLG